MAQGTLSASSFELSSPLIGREPAIEAMRRVAETVLSSNRPQIITVVGGSGAGKTRLIVEFRDELRTQGSFRAFRARAGKISSYGTFATILRTRLGVTDDIDPVQAMAKVNSQVKEILGEELAPGMCSFLAPLLNLPFPDARLSKTIAGTQSEQRLVRRGVIRAFFEADIEKNGPICLILDDLHAAGDDSLSLLRFLSTELQGPILFVCAARAELLQRDPGFLDEKSSLNHRIDLEPLSEEDSQAVMRAYLSPCEGEPPQALIDAAVRLARGAPGLLERMVRVFHDTGVLREDRGAWTVRLHRLDQVDLPMTADELAEARVSALSTLDRSLLRHAALMGMTFWAGGMLALRRSELRTPEYWNEHDRTREEIERQLSGLSRRGYIHPAEDQAFDEERAYTFNSATEFNVILQQISPNQSKIWHGILVDWLAMRRPTQDQEEHLSRLAQHMEAAGWQLRAGLTFLEAADLARERFALKKAEFYFRSGLELLATSDGLRRVEALHNYGDVLIALGRSAEALRAFEEMLSLAYRLDLHAKGGAAHNRIGRLHRDSGDLSAAQPHLEAALKLFDRANDQPGIAASHDDVGKLLWMRGEYDTALERLKIALEMRREMGNERALALSQHNIGVVWRDLGKARQAREALESALKMRRQLHDLLGVAQTLSSLGRLENFQRRYAEALELFEEAHTIAEQMGDLNRRVAVLANIGETHYFNKDLDRSIAMLLEAASLAEQIGDRPHLGEAKRALAKAYLLKADLKQARSCIRTAVDLFGQLRSKVHLATALRTLGEITAAGAWGDDHRAKADEYFMRSISLAKEIGNRFELAKSYRAFAQFLRGSGLHDDNQEVQEQAQTMLDHAQTLFNDLGMRHLESHLHDEHDSIVPVSQ